MINVAFFIMGFAKCVYDYSSLSGLLPTNKDGEFQSTVYKTVLQRIDGQITVPTFEDIKREILPPDISFPSDRDSPGGTEIEKINYLKNENGTEITVTNFKASVGLGFYSIQYYFYASYSLAGNDYIEELTLTYIFGVAENRLPPKKWTITDVINKILELAKPLRGEERPTIRLSGVEYETDENGYSSIKTPFVSGSLAERLDKILAPEFSLTKMTLREQLQAVGGYIHGEPRLTGKTTDSDGNEYFVLDFDFYGQKEYSKIKSKPFVTKTKNININDFCTSLDSSADNLVNQLDFANGVILEPFGYGDKSIRSDTVAVRLEESDGSAFIDTAFPIFTKPKVTAIWQGNEYDITPYVYEVTDYNNLNSYKGTYPYAKAYALYYTQGQKGIQGLFFKAPDAVDAVFKKYAISNIISAVTSTNVDFSTNINDKELINTDSLLNLTFRVEYLPISSARIKTNKSIVVDGLPRTLAYNQSANTIESRYFGENLKGVIARLGNVEKQITYALPLISDIPKEGLKYDDEYYISAVSTEYLPTYCKCTIGLTKYFNRQSEHIGINTNKRMWEISERQTQQRQTVLSEYLLIKESNNAIPSDNAVLFKNKPLSVLVGVTSQIVSVGVFKGYTKSGNAVNSNTIVLPVISSAFGNALSFTSVFEDNYSAGKTILKENNNAYSAYAPYTDNYGRIYYLDVEFKTTNTLAQDANANVLPILQNVTLENLGTSVVATESKRIKYRKDNREVPMIAYELQAVTDGSVIIGSALMRNCAFVNKTPRQIFIGYFRNKLNVISSELDVSDLILGTRFSEIDIDFTNGIITLPNISLDHSAWAIYTLGEEQRIQVVDDNGNAITQTISTGFELVIGQNKPAQGQKIAFAIKKDVYAKT